MEQELKSSRIELCVLVLEIIKNSIAADDNKVLCEMIQSDLNTSEHKEGVQKLCSDVLDESILLLNEFKGVLEG